MSTIPDDSKKLNLKIENTLIVSGVSFLITNMILKNKVYSGVAGVGAGAYYFNNIDTIGYIYTGGMKTIKNITDYKQDDDNNTKGYTDPVTGTQYTADGHEVKPDNSWYGPILDTTGQIAEVLNPVTWFF